MEIGRIKINGCECFVLFNGPHYYVTNHYYGLVCIATRDQERENEFTLAYGNEHTIGSCFQGCIIPAVKRYITKTENKYVRKDVNYTISGNCDYKRLIIETR